MTQMPRPIPPGTPHQQVTPGMNQPMVQTPLSQQPSYSQPSVLSQQQQRVSMDSS